MIKEWSAFLTKRKNVHYYFYYMDSFKNALLKTLTKFGKNKELKSDSWLTGDFEYLIRKLAKNYFEFAGDRNTESLVDIINYSLMILERKLIEEHKLKINSEYNKLVQENKDLSSNKYGDK